MQGKKHDRNRAKNKIFDILLKEGMKNQNQLLNEKKLGFNGNKRFLGDCLISLQEEKKILKIEVKGRELFMPAGDIEIMDSLREWAIKKENLFPKALETISETKRDDNKKRVTEFYTAFIIAALSNYLKHMYQYTNIDEKWKSTARFLTVKYDVAAFSELLNECKEANLDAFDDSVGAICGTLDEMSEDIWKKIPPVNKE